MFTKRRFHQHYWTACLLLLVSLLTRIQGRSYRSSSNARYNLQSSVIPHKNGRRPSFYRSKTTKAETLAAIDAALLQTRGGWIFRPRKREGDNETDANTTEVALTVDPREQAAQLRAQGKVNHDLGEFEQAAAQFQEAANLLGTLLLQQQQQQQNDHTSEEDNSGEDDAIISNITTTIDTDSSMIVITDDIEISDLQDEWATCRLHESLCHLKAQDYDACIMACDALVDEEISCAPVFRARAYHRRAKAKVALNDTDGALIDAKAAAFLGDRKAVTFYGKLLRESSSHDGSGMENPLEALFPSAGSAPGIPDSSLLGSLLSKSPLMNGNGNGNSNPTDFLTSSFLGSMGAPGGMPGTGGGGSLAKSVLKNLSKKLDDESTHDGICQYLQSTNALQLQSMASMAGLALSLDQASKLVNFAHSVTPRTIRKTVKYSKRALWAIQLIRKIMALLSKYRHILFLLVLLQWTKSAVVRPIPVPKVKAPRRPRGAARPALTTVPQPPPVPPPNTNANANTDNGGAAAAVGGGKRQLTPGLLNPLQGGGLR